MKIIELFGLPGSGKTFLANKLAYSLSQIKINFFERTEAVKLSLKRKDNGIATALLKKFPYFIWRRIIHEHQCLPEFLEFSANNIELISFYQRRLSESGASPETVRNILGAFVNTCVERQLFNMCGDNEESLLVDEGFCHRLFSLYGNLRIPCSQDDIRRYCELLPPLQGAIFIATPVATCVERMEKRKRFPVLLNCKNIAETKDILHHGQACFVQLVQELKRTNIPCFRYDGHSSDMESIANFCISAVGQNY